MDTRSFAEAVAERAGLSSREAAERAVGAVLEVLGECLPQVAARVVADQLPAGTSQPLRRGRGDKTLDLQGFVAAVAEREGTALGVALEHTHIVCQVVSETVNGEGLRHLKVHLPEPIADLFHRRAPHRPPAPTPRSLPTVPGAGPTLSEGRPGSRRPLSEAGADRAQSGSVARAENPHADVKLSSASGLSPERQGETLATGRPGSKKPLSEGREG